MPENELPKIRPHDIFRRGEYGEISLLNLVRMLYDRGHGRKEILGLFRFIDWLMVLPEDLERLFGEELRHLEKDKKMPYVTSVERIGIQKGEMAIVKRMLTRRFGQLPEWADKRLTQASSEELESWADRLLDAASVDEIFI